VLARRGLQQPLVPVEPLPELSVEHADPGLQLADRLPGRPDRLGLLAEENLIVIQ